MSLLPARPKQPLLVMNGDLLTRLNFRDLLTYHKEHKAAATLCIGEHHYQVPYGVAKVEDGRIVRLEEKPSSQYLVNAGVYVLNPELLDLIPSHGLYDMPALVDTVLASGRTVAAFPIRDYWFDIGRMEDLREARREGTTGCTADVPSYIRRSEELVQFAPPSGRQYHTRQSCRFGGDTSGL